MTAQESYVALMTEDKVKETVTEIGSLDWKKGER